MTYKNISNNTLVRREITYPWVFWNNVFTHDEIDTMCDYFEKMGVEESKVSGNIFNFDSGEFGTSLIQNHDVRKSNIMFHGFDSSNENTNWIFKRLNWVIEQLNNEYYNFDLNGFDFVQYTEYDESYLGKYDFHQDIVFGEDKPKEITDTRKLSVVLMLSEPSLDFEGGEFQINLGVEENSETIHFQKGSIIAFPSWQIHRVKPVIKGKRKTLVVWVTGPKFK